MVRAYPAATLAVTSSVDNLLDQKRFLSALWYP